MKPDRLAVFSYRTCRGQAAQKISSSNSISCRRNQTATAQTRHRKTHGQQSVRLYRHGPFCAANDELAVAQRNKQLQRNFQGYSTRAGSDIYAFGMSSISQIPEAYWQNEKELPKWQEAVDAGRVPLQRAYFLTDEDKIRRETIMRVMCDLSLDYTAMSQKLGINFAEHFAANLPRSRRWKPTAW